MPTPVQHHTAADIAVVASGLTRVVGPDGASVQLRRLYGEQRVRAALEPLASAGPRRPVDRRYHAVARAHGGTRTIWL